MRLICHGLSDTGRKRNHNEDSFLIDEELGLFVVADGMGGHAGGGTASRLAVETIDAQLRRSRVGSGDPFGQETSLADSPLPEVLRAAVEAASTIIWRTAQDDSRLAQMGTTAIAVLIRGCHAFFAHVGDSRAYLVRGELVQQISEDHSLVNEQVRAGMITHEEARQSRYKNIITRSVGFEPDVMVDVMGLVCEPGDTVVLCSDGLSNLVEDHEIHQVAMSKDVAEVPRRLIDLANARGGDDNITVVAVRMV